MPASRIVSAVMRKLSVILLVIVMLAAAIPAMAQGDTTGAVGGSLIVMPELFERANTAFETGDYQQAAVDYSLFIFLNPTFSQGYFNRALNYNALGSNDQALQDLTYALDYTAPATPYTSDIYLTRAQLYLNQNDLDAAVSDLNSSIEANPEAVNSLSLRAQILSFQQSYPEALNDYDKLIQLQPDQTVHYLDRGFIHAQLGHSQEALADFTHAIELSPQDAQPYALRAQYYTSVRNFTDALDDLNSAIDLSPNTGELYLMRGSINSSVNQPTEAAGDYFQWITLNRTQQYVSDALTNDQNFTVEMGPGWVYNIPFRASEGQTVNIAASSVSQQQLVDPLLVILDVDGSPLIADDDSGGNMAALIRNYTIPEDGEYTLVIGQAGGGTQQGDVAVQLDLEQE
jgi:tetratricopeptide (TPR) repeat protein